jgi:hypothetical protein
MYTHTNGKIIEHGNPLRFHGDYMGLSMAFNGHINDGIDLTNNDFHNGLFLGCIGIFMGIQWGLQNASSCILLSCLFARDRMAREQMQWRYNGYTVYGDLTTIYNII